MSITTDPQERYERLHRALGLRAHVEGCPEEALNAGKFGTDGIEAWEQKAPPDERAFGAGIKRLGLAPAGTFTTVACKVCQGRRYFAGTVRELLDRMGAS